MRHWHKTDPRLGNGFSDTIPKTQAMKKRKQTSPKLKIFVLHRILYIKKVSEDNPKNREKHLYIKMGLYLEPVKNSYNSIRRQAK